MGKWIGGFMGMMVAGPLGAIAGFVLGSLFNNGTSEQQDTNRNDYGHFDGPYSGYQTLQQQYEAQRNTFRFSLLVLASYIIRADGKVMHSEMNVVRNWLKATSARQQ